MEIDFYMKLPGDGLWHTVYNGPGGDAVLLEYRDGEGEIEVQGQDGEPLAGETGLSPKCGMVLYGMHIQVRANNPSERSLRVKVGRLDQPDK